jgi:aspartyl-tRNA(Asn)/glutamyl-tRNA(Gln) amidotransferase subunit C
MSKLTREDILKLAKLSRLELTDTEVDKFAVEISDILQYVQQLQGVNLSDLEPTYQVTGQKDVTRPDVVIDYGPTPKDLLLNAPNTEADHFKVNRMVV